MRRKPAYASAFWRRIEGAVDDALCTRAPFPVKLREVKKVRREKKKRTWVGSRSAEKEVKKVFI